MVTSLQSTTSPQRSPLGDIRSISLSLGFVDQSEGWEQQEWRSISAPKCPKRVCRIAIRGQRQYHDIKRGRTTLFTHLQKPPTVTVASGAVLLPLCWPIMCPGGVVRGWIGHSCESHTCESSTLQSYIDSRSFRFPCLAMFVRDVEILFFRARLATCGTHPHDFRFFMSPFYR
jgi:hypothetical protein